ncbi:influenza virus NS1A-binding protein homolog [Dermacentor variabilis]|uniref:influenza virus NS1A-binding protein homolog n=1 Tax=Dermacentor variabilis TaxID=34621 RepID=UPI003F5BCD44
MVVFRRRIYVVGGMKLRTYLRSMDSYDLDRGEWQHHSPMHVPRAYVTSAVLGEHIYAMGGHTGALRPSAKQQVA